jgi:hypothetical protein
LLTRRDTGHIRSASSGAGFSSSSPASPESHASATLAVEQHRHSVVD